MGTTVTWTATATGTVHPLQYRFERRDPSGNWSIVQSYGSMNTYTWTPTAADVGGNAIRVSVRNGGSLADFEDTATLSLRVVQSEEERIGVHAAPAPPPVALGVHYGTLATITAPPRRHSFYTPELQLLAETEITTAAKPPVQYEYVWFGGEPLAQITSTTGEIHWYFKDHLGAPILQTGADATIRWRVEYDPYGTVFAYRTGAEKHQPLRFPGQENDGSTELTYNVFRWYRSGVGAVYAGGPSWPVGWAESLLVCEGTTDHTNGSTWTGHRV